MAMHALFLILKKQSETDNFFSLHSKTDEKSLIRRFLLLSQMNGRDYSAEMLEVKNMFSDHKLDEREIERLDSIVVERYFDNSYALKTTWKRSDASLRWISFAIVLSIATALCIGFGARMFAVRDHIEIDYNDLAIFNGFFFLPLGILLGILLQGVYSAFLLVISMFIPSRGSVTRARVCMDRFWGGIGLLVGNGVDMVTPKKMKEEE
jgi:hypothetical protein